MSSYHNTSHLPPAIGGASAVWAEPGTEHVPVRAAGRPPGFPNSRAWLVDGALQNPRSVIAAILVGWFNVPIAVFLAGVGLVSGALSGMATGVVGPASLPYVDLTVTTHLLQVGAVLGGVLGGVLGLLGGLLAGLVGAWLLVAGLDPLEGIFVALLQVLLAVVVGVLYTLYAVAFEEARLKLSGARRLSRRESELLHPIMNQLLGELQLTKGPRLMIDDSRELNAFAYTRHVVITGGTLEEFDYDPEAIAGVLAHEVVHWATGDAVSATFVRGVALPLYLVYSGVTAIMRVLPHPLTLVIGWLLTWPILVSVRYIMVPLQSIEGRSAEYRADQGAVVAGHRAGIRTVLSRFRETLDGSRNGWDAAICASHPPNELRLEAVEEQGQHYPLTASESVVGPAGVDSTVRRD